MSSNLKSFHSGKHFCIAFFLLLSLLFTRQVMGQEQYVITIKVVACGNNYWDGDSKGARYRFNGEYTPGSGSWWDMVRDGNCFQGAAWASTYYPPSTNNFNILWNTYANSTSPRQVRILFGTHHERKDGSDACTAQGTSGVTFNHPDLWNTDQIHTINFDNIPPGVFTAVPRIYNYISGGPTTWADLELKYNVLRPEIPKLKDEANYGPNICPNQLLTLKAKSSNHNNTGIKYRWQYMRATSTSLQWNPDYCGPADPMMGCGHYETGYYWDSWCQCYQWGEYWVQDFCCDNPQWIPTGTWVPLTNTLPYNSPTSDSMVFSPLADVFSNSLGSSEVVYFRVQAYTSTEDASAWSNMMSINFSAQPPSLPEVALTTQSCPGSPTGSITLNNISGVGTYLYMLNAGYDNVIEQCDPAVQNCVGFSIASGYFSGNTLSLSNLPAGEYTLRIANPAGIYGTCSVYQNIKIDSFPPVVLAVDTFSQMVSCFGATDGWINLSSTGGNRSVISYTVKNTISGQLYNNTSGNFTGLPPANYQVTVTDACMQKSEALIVIGEPTRVEGVPVVSQPTCTTPVNGKISVTASKGSGIYNYLLTKNSATVASLDNTADIIWQVENLDPGNYVLSIKDAERTSCLGYTYNFTVNAPAPLTLSLLQNNPIPCYGAANGYIQLQAQGGQSLYTYYLVDNATQQLTVSNNGEFINVAAGTYTAYVKNRDVACTDSTIYSSPIIMVQPAQVIMAFDLQYIVCKGQNNGSITLTSISGGTGTFTYIWQQKQNGSWFDYTANGQGSGTSITNLYPGLFRLMTVDQQGCEAYSEEMEVKEPEFALIFSSLTVNDIKCLNGTGSIIPEAAGGHGGYTYYYSASGGPYTAYNPLTQTFGIGTYTVKVKDSVGCELIHPTPITITTPATVLSFTTTLSVYGAHNISCFGNLNGSITVNATGGNGGSYSGYQYALNANGPWQTSNLFDGLGAGVKTVYVKDGRGCTVTQNVTLTQPASIITVTSTAVNPVCASDSTGSITITASGGVPPYQYKLVRTGSTGAWWENYQSSNVFNNILWGQYSITVRDQNGCTRVATKLLTYKSTGPTIAVNKQNISCFGGNTGSIAVTVTSGINKVTPYVYSWTGVTATTPTVSSLVAGAYSVRVTDSLGCRKDSLIVLTHPADLEISANTRPICVGSSDGKITLNALGGVAPYTYSKDNGSNYQTSNEFTALPVGNYLMKVRDANNCTDTMSIALVNRNTGNTYVNFLVSSSQNAYDTAVVKEVCSPKPDSVKWQFPAAASIIDDNEFSPKIKFTEPGTYAVTMIPYFGGCDLPMQKNIEIKPFDSTIVYTNPNIIGIDTVMVMPNPNTGQFSLQVKLFRHQKLDVYIRSVTGALIYYRHWNSVKEVMETINMNANGFLPAGTYFLKVVTDNDARDKLIIKQ